MAERNPTLGHAGKGETSTSNRNGLDVIPRIVVPIMRVNHVFLVPWIILSVPAVALFQQQVLAIFTITIIGLAGMLTRSSTAASLASASLLFFIVWGKIAGDIYGLSGSDTALLLLEFMVVILLMEASTTTLTIDAALTRLHGRNDDISKAARARVTEWATVQLLSLGKIAGPAFGLSLGLLVIGDLVSVSINQLAFSGVLVLAAVAALLVLLTYRREPEERGRRLV